MTLLVAYAALVLGCLFIAAGLAILGDLAINFLKTQGKEEPRR